MTAADSNTSIFLTVDKSDILFYLNYAHLQLFIDFFCRHDNYSYTTLHYYLNTQLNTLILYQNCGLGEYTSL